MNRIKEIEERLTAIKAEVETDGADITALNAETDALLEERSALMAEVETRKSLLEKVANLPADTAEPIVQEDNTMEEIRTLAVDSAEYRDAYIKVLQGKKLSEVEERSFAQNGSPVPTIIATQFIEKMKKLAPMLSEITLMHVAGNLKFQVEGTRNDAYQHTENANITESGDSFVTVTLGAYEFAKVIGISKSAANMSIPEFQTWLVNIIAGDIARKIDSFIVSDVLAADTSITVDTISAAAYTYGSILKVIGDLPAAYDAEAKFLMNKKTLYGNIASIVDSTGNPIFVSDPEVGVGRIMGYPVILDDYVATTKGPVYLGKFSDIVGNMSEPVQVERSTEAGFLQGTIYYRGYAAFDAKLTKGDAIVKMILT